MRTSTHQIAVFEEGFMLVGVDWRDVTPDLGGYLFPGAKRNLRVSAQFDL